MRLYEIILWRGHIHFLTMLIFMVIPSCPVMQNECFKPALVKRPPFLHPRDEQGPNRHVHGSLRPRSNPVGSTKSQKVTYQWGWLRTIWRVFQSWSQFAMENDQNMTRWSTYHDISWHIIYFMVIVANCNKWSFPKKTYKNIYIFHCKTIQLLEIPHLWKPPNYQSAPTFVRPSRPPHVHWRLPSSGWTGSWGKISNAVHGLTF